MYVYNLSRSNLYPLYANVVANCTSTGLSSVEDQHEYVIGECLSSSFLLTGLRINITLTFPFLFLFIINFLIYQ